MGKREQVLERLDEELGAHRKERHDYNYRQCPYCSNDRWNFAVNLEKHVFHCWACDEGGGIYRLLRRLGIVLDFEIDFKKHKEERVVPGVIPLPEGTVEISQAKDKAKILGYLGSRDITEEDIKRYSIKWSEKQKRIVFPFTDLAGEVIFWNARTIYKDVKPKYLHSAVPKSEMVLQYHGVGDEIWIVEGVFDGIAVNKLGKTVVMLMGSSISEHLMTYLRTLKTPVVLCLDSDMMAKQAKYEKELRSVLGSDKVRALFLKGKDVSESGVDGDSGFAGYVRRKMKI